MGQPDFQSLGSEVLDLLQRYIRVNTTNPPGNEELATDFLAPILEAVGIECQKLVSAPGRANLIATLPAGNDEVLPLVLLNHTDVVPVEADQWQVDPFQGVVRDGFVWGRG